jgi:hypothetical protein
MEYANAAAVAATVVPVTVTVIQLQDYWSSWVRSASQPGHTGYIQDQSGAYFAYADNDINILALGADPTGTDSSLVAVNKAVSLAEYRGEATVKVPHGDYLLTGAVTRYAAPILWQGEPGSRFICQSASDVTFFTWHGPGLTGTNKTLAYDTPRGYFAIPVRDTGGMSVGDLVHFGFSDPNGFLHTDISRVRATGQGAGEIQLINVLSTVQGSGTITVHLENHGVFVGGPIVVRCNTEVGGTLPVGLATVTSIIDKDHFTFALPKGQAKATENNGGGTIRLTSYALIVDAGIPFDLNVAADIKSIHKWVPSVGGGFVDLEFDGTSSTGSVTAIEAAENAFATIRVRIKGFHAAAFDGAAGAGLILSRGYANHVDIFTEYCGSGGKNDCSLYQQVGLTGRLQSSRAFGFGPGLYWNSRAKLQSIIVEGAGERGFKLNGSCECDIDTIDNDSAGFTGVGITGASCYNRVKVVRSRNSRNAEFWTSNEYSQNNWIGYMEVEGSFNTSDVEIYPKDTGNVIDQLKTPRPIYNGGNAVIHWLNGKLNPG